MEVTKSTECRIDDKLVGAKVGIIRPVYHDHVGRAGILSRDRLQTDNRGLGHFLRINGDSNLRQVLLDYLHYERGVSTCVPRQSDRSESSDHSGSRLCAKRVFGVSHVVRQVVNGIVVVIEDARHRADNGLRVSVVYHRLYLGDVDRFYHCLSYKRVVCRALSANQC